MQNENQHTRQTEVAHVKRSRQVWEIVASRVDAHSLPDSTHRVNQL